MILAILCIFVEIISLDCAIIKKRTTNLRCKLDFQATLQEEGSHIRIRYNTSYGWAMWGLNNSMVPTLTDPFNFN